MYTEFYGFKEKPFNIVSDPGFLYMSSKHQMAINYLEYGLMDGIGFILLTGEIGTGKTTLIKRLVQKVRGDLEVAVVFNTNVTAAELLELILEEFEQGRPEGGKAAYLDMLNQYLIAKHAQGKRVLLIVDEAQNLTQEALEEIRMLSNLQTNKASLIQILLVGQPNLRARLQHPKLTQLSQRIAISYHLRPLDLKETKNYIVHRLKISGGENENLFTDKAIEKIFDYAGGVPRNINVLCDAALVYGYADELTTIDEPVVDNVIEDKKEMGSLGVLSPQETSEVTVNGSDGYNTFVSRLENLEQQVYRLAATVEWQNRKLEEREESYRDVLVGRMEAMLKEERRRSDQLLAQCHILKDRLQLRNIQSSGEKGKKAPGMKEKKTVDESSVADHAQNGKGDGKPNMFQRWFGK